MDQSRIALIAPPRTPEPIVRPLLEPEHSEQLDVEDRRERREHACPARGNRNHTALVRRRELSPTGAEVAMKDLHFGAETASPCRMRRELCIYGTPARSPLSSVHPSRTRNSASTMAVAPQMFVAGNRERPAPRCPGPRGRAATTSGTRGRRARRCPLRGCARLRRRRASGTGARRAAPTMGCRRKPLTGISIGVSAPSTRTASGASAISSCASRSAACA